MSIYTIKTTFRIFLVCFCFFIAACASKKSGRKVSVMKNLTAHYNIYFNAAELLHESELSIRNAIRDDYNQQLEIFPLAEPSETENLNLVITKANKIALEKFESNWIDDAFLLLAKAEYYKGNYYNAAEYFSYVSQNFPKERTNKVEALVWEARSYFALNNYQYADTLLRVAYDANQKYYRAELNAALANAAIHHDSIASGIKYLQKAVNFSKDKYSKIRWTFILAQLQELNNQKDDAYRNYSKVTKSNAAFEMAFNANLARIRIQENESGKAFDKIATLKRLLKEDKNKEFKDQIYYQIANTYLEQNRIDLAAEYYNTSAHTVPGTVKQKGLSFLRLAELNFDSLKNYSQAQLYYDSTLMSLPNTYPGYNQIAKKANNLQYLAARLTTINQENELLMLASLTDEERTDFINKKISVNIEKEALAQNQISNAPASITNFSENNKNGSTFYFYNSQALSQGLTEFKKRWGNRKLEDNWRFSAGGLATGVAQNVNFNGNINNGINSNLKTKSEVLDSLRNKFLSTIPLSDQARQQSETKIKNAWMEIALFYKDVLNDKNAAINTFEQLLSDYPNNTEKPSIYYQLYRLYEPENQAKSTYYKNLLLKDHSATVYAKSISDPNFGKEAEAELLQVQKKYADIYQNYQQKKYQSVITEINTITEPLKNYPALAPKFFYLKALAIGNTQKAPLFIANLEQIVKDFPEDSIVTPLVKSQLSYITKNRSVFDNRPTALIAYDANETVVPQNIYIPKAEPEIAKVPSENKSAPAENTKIPAKEIPKAPDKLPANAVALEKPAVTEPEKPKALIFNTNARSRHMIVVDIKNNLNAAKAFASLNNYFYSKFDPSKVALTIRPIGNTDKLIIINAQLNSKDLAEKASAELGVELAKLLNMKPSDYLKFVISESNLQMINSKESLAQYLNSIK